jgi:hypothetical protein
MSRFHPKIAPLKTGGDQHVPLSCFWSPHTSVLNQSPVLSPTSYRETEMIPSSKSPS